MQTQSQRQDATSKYHYRDFAPIRLKWPIKTIPWSTLEKNQSNQKFVFHLYAITQRLRNQKNAEKSGCQIGSDLTSEI